MNRGRSHQVAPGARSLAAVIGGAAVLGLAAEHLAHSWDGPAWIPIADLGIGWIMVGSGIGAMLTWPSQVAGSRLVLAGFLWFVGTFFGADDPGLAGLGFAFGGYHDPVLLLLALAFPGRWPSGRASRALLGVVIGLYAVQSIARLILIAPGAIGVTVVDPDMALAIVVRVDIARAFAVMLGGVAALVMLVRLPAPRRGDRGVVLAAGAASAVAGGWSGWYAMTVVGLAPTLDDSISVPAAWLFNLMRIVVPLAILAGIARARASRAAMVAAVASVGASSTTQDLREALSIAMRDPGLAILEWDGAAYAGAGADVLTAEQAEAAQADGQLLLVRGAGDAPLAAIRLTRPASDSALVDSGVALTRLVVENERLAGQVRLQLDDVRASRTRIVEAAAEERRRIERDLHDGLQQRMVALALQLQAAGPNGDDREATLRSGAAEVLGILEDVRELARGIHPPVLVQAGLAAAIRAVADRSPIPAELDVDLAGAGSEAAKATAYFVVSEALANSAKHAPTATTVWVIATDGSGRLRVSVEDDGPGGADPAGSGLRGLADRVAALGGKFTVDGRPGGGTRVVAEIPV